MGDPTEETGLDGPDAEEVTLVWFPFVELDPFLFLWYTGSFEVCLLHKLLDPVMEISIMCECKVVGFSNLRLS